MYLVICNNTKENFLWEPEKMNVKFHKITSYTWNFQNFTCVITILVKFDIHFLGLPREIFFSVLTDIDDWLYLKPLKNVKKNAIFFKLFWQMDFVYWKLKLINFLVDYLLSLMLSGKKDIYQSITKSFQKSHFIRAPAPYHKTSINRAINWQGGGGRGEGGT